MRQFSYSKIEKYLKCSWWYYLKNVLRLQVPTDSVPTVAGTITHTVLEEYVNIGKALSPLEVLDIVWANKLAELQLGDQAAADLAAIARDVAHLNVRATAAYKGLDAIRDENGKAYKNPKRSNAYGKAEKALNLPQRRDLIDIGAASAIKLRRQADPKADLDPWDTVSISEVYALTYTFLDGYVDTLGNMGLTVLAQELPISLPKRGSPRGTPAANVVKLPNGDIYAGFIDVIATDEQGRLYVIDHKTSKEAPSSAKVSVWDQLLLYCWAHHQLWGRWPEFMGINSVLARQLILVRVDPVLAEQAVQRKMQAIKGIDAEVFIQQSPSEYGSNCWNDYTKQGCEYLWRCHPGFAQQVGAARPDYVNTWG